MAIIVICSYHLNLSSNTISKSPFAMRGKGFCFGFCAVSICEKWQTKSLFVKTYFGCLSTSFLVNNFVNVIKGDIMQQLLYFLLNYKTFVLIAMFGILSITALVNFVYNPYGKQNAKLKRFNKKMLKYPSSVVTEIHLLPKEYQRQWRAYVNSGCNKPSTVFEFVKLPTPYLLWFAHFVATATSTFYFVVAILLNYSSLFTTQIVFLLLSAIVLIVKKIIDQINLAHARKIFGKFLHDLNRITQLYKNTNQQQNSVENHTSTQQSNASFNAHPLQQSAILSHNEQISQSTAPLDKNAQQPTFPTIDISQQPSLQSNDQTDAQGKLSVDGQALPMGNTQRPLQTQSLPQAQTPSITIPPQAMQSTLDTPSQGETSNETIVDKAVRILRQKGLENPRTVEEQRKLNLALNNLLQACCKRN